MAKSNFFNVIPGASGEAALLLYGEVGDYCRVDSERVVRELLTLTAMYNKIDVRINSPGGDVFSGIAIYNALRTSTADITIYIDGMAASIAGVIALCGKPLYMSPYAKLMLHNVSGGAYGNSKELREVADMIDNLQGDLSKMIAGRCKMQAEEVSKTYFEDGKDHWINADDALSMGLIDGIYDMIEPIEGLTPQSSAEDVYKSFNNKLNQETEDMALLDELKKKPSFAALGTETAILAHIASLEVQAAEAAELKGKVTQLEEQLQASKEAELAGIVNQAISEGKIQEAQKATYLNLLKADRASAVALLDSLQPAPKGGATPRAMQDIVPGSGATVNKFAGKSWSDLDREGLLAQYKAADLEGFKALFKEKFGVDYKE